MAPLNTYCKDFIVCLFSNVHMSSDITNSSLKETQTK